MKKLITPLLAVVMALGALIPAAVAGDRTLSFGLGPVFPQADLEDAVDLGLDFQGRLMQEVDANISVGGQFDLLLFGEDEVRFGSPFAPGVVETDLQAISLQAIGAVQPGETGRARPYGFAGFGLVFAFSETRVSYGAISAKDDDTEVDWTLSLGGGVDIPTESGRELGLSLRYQIFEVNRIDDSALLALMAHVRFPAK